MRQSQSSHDGSEGGVDSAVCDSSSSEKDKLDSILVARRFERLADDRLRASARKRRGPNSAPNDSDAAERSADFGKSSLTTFLFIFPFFFRKKEKTFP